MIDHKRNRGVFVLLALFAAVALLGACGNSNKKSTSPAAAVSLNSATAVGINVCATCHTVVATDWLTSKHANVVAGLNSVGAPSLGGSYTAASCGQCHDPNGDSGNIITAGYIGSVARPIVGCEACHGGGSLHVDGSGSGPIGFTSTSAGVIGSTQVSAQFKTCTACHELLDTAGTGTNLNPAHLTIPPTGNQFTITNTHFAQPGTWRNADGLNTHNTTTDFIAVFGYAMDFTDEKVCSNCHNPHKTATINKEWAQSAHADRQGIKMDPRSSAIVGFFGGAWAHYNWSTSSRTACQRCHTTTGFIAYADALRTGNAGLATAIRTGAAPPLNPDPNFKPQMLECNGCHTDNRGTLRNPGQVTANYDYVSGTTTFALASHTYPDVAGSNVCMACHTARESGDTIKNVNQAGFPLVDFSNLSFINSHYLSAGGTIFTATGYTFGNGNYANIAAYRHDQIGSSGAPNTGSNGPCIGCHMSRPNNNGNHIFLPVSRVMNATTKKVTITGITSEVCFNCHGPNDILMLDLVQEQKEQFGESLEALKAQLEKRGYYFADANPYFYKLRTNSGLVSVTTGSTLVTNVTASSWIASGVTGTTQPNSIQDRFRVNDDGAYYAVESVVDGSTLILQAPYTGPTNTGASYTIIGAAVKKWLTTAGPAPFTLPDTDTTGAVSGKNNMGAAFDFNLLEHDPGAFAHNRYYVKRLIYDAIDWLDDNQLNFSVGTTLSAVCTGPTPPTYCVRAMTYLLPNGVINGVAAERP
jgi:hypothetical protein